jgi:starch synthase
MRILMVSAEASPFVKTGGLGDVLGSLPAALARQGEEVAVLLPRYQSVSTNGAERIASALSLFVGPHGFSVDIDRIEQGGVSYLFADCAPLYDRPEIYGSYPDNAIRFALLSQAALGVARYVFRPHVFHVHDWTGGLLGPYLRTNLAGDPTFLGARVIFTIHNLGYQGNFPLAAMSELGLSQDVYRPEGLEFWGRVSFLKAGIVWADAITTVSPTYAREIQTPEHGFGMEGVLRERAGRLSGILNGVDYSEWDPGTDAHLAACYSADDLSGKRASKKALLAELRLPDDEAALERPLVGIVSRFAAQKGFDLLMEIAPWLMGQDLALAVLGSGEERLERMFRDLASAHPDKVAVRLGYDHGLSHRIEAGADMFLMPSRYEPCGLNQIYSLRYGTVPIVRATGGLEDTVDASTGFKFRGYSGANLRRAIGEALAAYRNRDGWTARMCRGMSKDFSWGASAAKYRRLYREVRGAAGNGRANWTA